MENVSSLLQCLVFFQNYEQGFKASEGDFMMPYITAIDFWFDEFKIWWIKIISLGAYWEKMCQM